MLDKKYYHNNLDKLKQMSEEVCKDPFLPCFHIYPKSGWLNDPNGLCQVDGTYHIYFQYSPFDENKKDILWGHVSSKDLISFTREEPFIYSDSEFDRDGAYSGSAFVANNEINFFYTGNVKYDGDYDYVNDGREHNTIRVKSKDGVTYDYKELLLTNSDYPVNMTKHVRDPKIFNENNFYYMFLGARNREDKGLVLVYKSSDLKDFSYFMTIESVENFGYMWECPDYFKLNKQGILICCPQGVEKEDFKYQNIYQAGYFPINMDLENKKYELGDFYELDYGFDFYAPQTFEDEKGRRILIGWMGMPDADYTNPTTKYKWQHCLTIPRELKYDKGKLYQKPISELCKLRKEKISLEKGDMCNLKVYEAFSNNISSEFEINLRGDVKLSYQDENLTLNMGENSFGRKIRKVKIENIENIRIYSDKSSLEIFINDGSYVLSTRVYTKDYLFYSKDLDFTIYPLKNITIK